MRLKRSMSDKVIEGFNILEEKMALKENFFDWVGGLFHHAVNVPTASLNTIVSELDRFDPNGVRKDKVGGVILEKSSVDIHPGKKIVNVRTESENKWEQFIQFFNIDSMLIPDGEYQVKIVNPIIRLSRGAYFVKPFNYNSTKVGMHCSCPDFQYTFEWWLHEKFGALPVGYEPIPYTPSPGSNRPPRNPEHYAGCCKHILALIDGLSKDGYIR